MEMKCRAFIAVVGSVAVALGGQASYGHSPTQMWRKAAVYVDKILKLPDPAELPVEQPVVFELGQIAKQPRRSA